MKLTKKQIYDNHYLLWDDMYHNPKKEKSDWHRWKYNGGDIGAIQDNCFLCEWFAGRGGCAECLLGGFDFFEHCDLFHEWGRAKTLKTKKKYAKLIRDIVL